LFLTFLAQVAAAEEPATNTPEQQQQIREPGPSAAELQQQIRWLVERQQQLEAKLAQKEPIVAGPRDGGPLLGFGSNGFFLGTRDSAFQLRLRGVIQADGRAFFGDNSPQPDQFLIRRARPIVEGTVAQVIDFRLLPDFGQGNLQLLEAFVDLHPWTWLAVRAGKFKTPFGLERLQEEQYLLFIERGLTQNLVPDRDIGASLHGEVAAGSLLYEIGVFNGTVDGGNVDGDTNDGKDFVFRGFSHPFAKLHSEWISKLGFGFAATYGKERGTLAQPGLAPYKTTGQNNFFTYLTDPAGIKTNVIALSTRYRLSPQLYYYFGPVGILAEYVSNYTGVNVPVPTVTLNDQAWQVHASLVLTLEHASYTGVDPKRPFNLARRHFGAFEIAARYGELRIDPATFPKYADPNKSARAALEWAVELNWYLTRLAKFALLFERTTFTGGAPKGADRSPENGLLGRVQVAF
jgi:phosphate-selective porin OprO/OprP